MHLTAQFSIHCYGLDRVAVEMQLAADEPDDAPSILFSLFAMQILAMIKGEATEYYPLLTDLADLSLANSAVRSIAEGKRKFGDVDLVPFDGSQSAKTYSGKIMLGEKRPTVQFNWTGFGWFEKSAPYDALAVRALFSFLANKHRRKPKVLQQLGKVSGSCAAIARQGQLNLLNKVDMGFKAVLDAQ